MITEWCGWCVLGRRKFRSDLGNGGGISENVETGVASTMDRVWRVFNSDLVEILISECFHKKHGQVDSWRVFGFTELSKVRIWKRFSHLALSGKASQKFSRLVDNESVLNWIGYFVGLCSVVNYLSWIKEARIWNTLGWKSNISNLLLLFLSLAVQPFIARTYSCSQIYILILIKTC